MKPANTFLRAFKDVVGCLWQKVIMTYKEMFRIERKKVTLENMVIFEKYFLCKPLRVFGKNTEATWCIESQNENGASA